MGSLQIVHFWRMAGSASLLVPTLLRGNEESITIKIDPVLNK